MSRPHSPFKLSSRPTSRSSSSRPPPVVAMPSGHGRSISRSKWMGFVPGGSTGSSSLTPSSAALGTSPTARRGSTASSNGAGPSPSPHASSHSRASSTSNAYASAGYDDEDAAAPSPLPRGDYVTRAEHYDVVLERGEDEDGEEYQAQTILPILGHAIVDQTGRIEGEEPDSRSPGVTWQSSPFSSSNGAAGDSSFPRSGSGGSITAVRRPYSAQGDTSFDGGRPAKARDERSEKEKEDKYRSALLELLSTERSYVKRIETLYHRYANPLRQMARDKDTAIIPLYEAQRLFGNIGEILGANSAFLKDLERVVEGGEEGRLGEVVYRHLACFHCYNEYLSNIEKAKHVEQTMSKSNRSFREFVDRTKYSTQGLGNIGLRELLMEPVQRIPRYTLLLDLLLRNLPASKESMRRRLTEANSLAAKIASREVDEQTRRAAVLWSLSRCVDGFPAGLISVHRQFVDCIDVEDFPMDVFGASLFSPSSSISAGTSGVHHCTLFLFDDRLVVCKRASSSSSGRRIVGLDDLNRLADLMKTCTERSGKVDGSGSSKELGFRGMIDIQDVRARDLGAADFQLFFSASLSHVTSEKWAHRPVRQYATHDSYVSNPGPSGGVSSSSTSYAFGAQSENAYQGASGPDEKVRFLENLWRAQALGKTKERRSQVRCSVFPPVAAHGEEARVRRMVFWNVYSRRGYLLENRKAPVVLHVDPLRQADDVPLGHETAPPHASLRLHSVDEDYAECSYSVFIKGTDGSSEQHLLPLTELPTRLRALSNDMSSQYEDDFAPNRSRASPSTPASHRGRMVQGLENFGRNLFGGGASTPGSFRSAAGSDLFGSPRRNKSSASKGSSSAAVTLSRKGSSSAHTYSTMQTSVGSRDMLGSKLSPESAWHAAYLAQGPGHQHTTAQHLERRRSQSRSRAATPELYERHRRAISEGPGGEGGSPARSAMGDVTARYDDSADVDVTLAAAATGLSPNAAANTSLRQRTRSTPSRPADWATHSSRPPSSSGREERTTPLGASRGYSANRQGSASPIRRKPPPKASAYGTDGEEVGDVSAMEGQEAGERDFNPSPPVRRGYGSSASKRALPSDAPQGANSSAKRHTSFGSERHRSVRPSSRASHRGGETQRMEGIDDSDAIDAAEAEDGWDAIKRDLDLINARGSERLERREATKRIEEALARLRGRFDDACSSAAQPRPAEPPGPSERESALSARVEELEKEAKELRPLKGRLLGLERKCELLTTLEEDGRRENEILHKAFNEELDALYEQTQLPSSEEGITHLRNEIKRTKAQRNDVWQSNKGLQRELALEKAQREVYQRMLEEKGWL